MVNRLRQVSSTKIANLLALLGLALAVIATAHTDCLLFGLYEEEIPESLIK